MGVLGYFTPARILDTVGLNSPVSTGYYPLPAADYVINYAIPVDLILDQRPDWVVILEVYGRRTLLPDPRFQRLPPGETLPTDMYGSQGMLIFERANDNQPSRVWARQTTLTLALSRGERGGREAPARAQNASATSAHHIFIPRRTQTPKVCQTFGVYHRALIIHSRP